MMGLGKYVIGALVGWWLAITYEEADRKKRQAADHADQAQLDAYRRHEAKYGADS
jgi:membrane protein YqaA with SNARE-associated domain